MRSTTIHIDDEILDRKDRAAQERGISRDRFIVKACEPALQGTARDRPDGFFEDYQDKTDLSLLQEAGFEMEEVIRQRRRNRGDSDS